MGRSLKSEIVFQDGEVISGPALAMNRAAAEMASKEGFERVIARWLQRAYHEVIY